ncbi:MAG: lipocalin family protein [Pseudomonadota bacterium]
MRLLGCAVALVLLNEGAAVAQTVPLSDLKSVPSVDLARYQGHWYQIAHYPNFFQKQCVSHTTADYKLLEGGQVEVTNRCKTADGSDTAALALARVQQPGFFGGGLPAPSTARLEVRFAPAWLSWLPGVWANYWVIQLAEDYRYAVVGEPKRQYLWILSRTPTLAAPDRAAINAALQQQGYDPAKLQEEPQR